MQPQITWEYSLDSEAKRLLHIASQAVKGFYSANNFLLLPASEKYEHPSAAMFPDLNYNSIPRFWNQVKKIDIKNFPHGLNTKLVEQTKSLLAPGFSIPPNFSKTMQQWKLVSDKTINSIYTLLPGKTDFIKKIIIHPSHFGPPHSFNRLDKPGELVLFLRHDQGVKTIVEAIISSMTRTDVHSLGGHWTESELLADWIINHTLVSKYLNEDSSYAPTSQRIKTLSTPKLKKISDDFYNKLGIDTTKNFISQNNMIFANEKPIKGLTHKQKILMDLFITNKNKVIDYDQIGDVLFDNDDDFSLYAIAKQIERIRNKLENHGIAGTVIQSARGKGYYLNI